MFNNFKKIPPFPPSGCLKNSLNYRYVHMLALNCTKILHEKRQISSSFSSFVCVLTLIKQGRGFKAQYDSCKNASICVHPLKNTFSKLSYWAQNPPFLNMFEKF